MSSWKLFRQISDENVVTARHIAEQPLFHLTARPALLDIGCGDGLLIRELLTLLPDEEKVSLLKLLDPDPALLREAANNIASTNLVAESQIELHECRVREGIPAAYGDIGVALGVHVAYLLDRDELSIMLNSLPIGVPLYVVIDQPHSIFSQLWEMTAPKYYRRSQDAHATIADLGANFQVSHSVVTSSLQDPYQFRHDVANGLLSILCYSEFDKLSLAIQLDVQSIIRGSIIEGVVRCSSSCYEISRLR